MPCDLGLLTALGLLSDESPHDNLNVSHSECLAFYVCSDGIQLM